MVSIVKTPSTRDHILQHLWQHQDQWVSGEELSGQLGISRTAINKHIGHLRSAGYTIESSPKKGYQFRAASPHLLTSEIHHNLHTRLLGQEEIYCLESVESTNEYARKLAMDGAAEGTLVVTGNQVQGRGRRQRPWFSPSGSSVSFSLILRPRMSASDAPRIAQTAAVAIATALEGLIGKSVHIKWPNDILIDGRKVAGILAEMSTEMDSVEFLILGVGINVNTDANDFPPELGETATSLRICGSQTFHLASVVRACLESLEQYYSGLLSEGFAPIAANWSRRCAIEGKRIQAHMVERTIEGVVQGMDHDGALLLKDDTGHLWHLLAADVTLKPGGK